MHAFETWHAEACEPSNLVQAGGIILARIRMALIDVHLTAGACVTLQTLTVEGAFCIHTFSSMFTRITIGHGTFIHIISAGSPLVALWTGADVLPIQGVGVTQRPLVARVANARIIQVTQKTRLSFWACAGEGGHTVNAGGARSAGSKGAVINILAAVVAAPSIDTDTSIAPIVIGAGTSILTSVGL